MKTRHHNRVAALGLILLAGMIGASVPAQTNTVSQLPFADPLENLILSIPDARTIDKAYQPPDPSSNSVLSLNQRLLRDQLNQVRSGEPKAVDPEIDALIEQANRLLLDNQGHQATRLFYRATRRNPDNPQALNGMAIGFSLSGDLERAALLYAALIDRFPKEPLFRTNLATVHLYRGEFQKAMNLHPEAFGNTHLAAGNQVAGTLHRAYFQRAQQQLKAGRGEEGLQSLLIAQAMQPRNEAYFLELIRYMPTWHRGFHPQKGYLQLEEGDANNHAEFSRQGLAALQVGKSRSALFHLSAAVLSNPTNPEYLNDLGVALRMTGYTRPAAVLFRAVLTIDPTQAKAQRNLVTILPELGQANNPEIKRLKALADLDVKNAEVHHQLAGKYLLSGDLEQAVVHFRTAANQHPDDPRYLGALLNALLLDQRETEVFLLTVQTLKAPSISEITKRYVVERLVELVPAPWGDQAELVRLVEAQWGASPTQSDRALVQAVRTAGRAGS